jgi:hypothetical protein
MSKYQKKRMETKYGARIMNNANLNYSEYKHRIKKWKTKKGVAYLDDGTMVVVDNSRKMIGQNIDVTVTSVLQTTVGKMIFGRYNEVSR